jgi:diguanylate cyclase (GGDEF)-like protein
MGRDLRGWFVALLAIAFAGIAMASESLVGSPPWQRFVPDLDIHPQNYSVAQDAHGVLYVGNQEGVLEFDGETWRLLRLPNREIVRSLMAGPDGRIYVGGYNSFGYLVRDRAGVLAYRELADRYAASLDGREFADIWDILVAPEGVYFRAVRDVFFWDPHGGAPKHWYHDDRFGGIAHHDGQTLLQFRGEGFKRRVGDDWALLPETAPLVNLVYRVLPLDDGGLLTMGSDGAWWDWRDGALTPATMPPGMPRSDQFENGLRLTDGSYAFGSRDGVVYLVAPDRRSERHFKLASAFLTDMGPADGGFLLSSDQAVFRVDWPSAWNVVGSEDGADGSLFGLADFDGQRYLMTSSGAHPVRRTESGSLRIDPDPWQAMTAFDLAQIAPGKGLLARAHRLHVVDAKGTRELSTEQVYPRVLRHSRFHPERWYVGTELGLRWVDVHGDDIALAPARDGGEPMRVNSLVEADDGVVWVGSERDGVRRYRFTADGEYAGADRVGPEQGLVYGDIEESWLTRLDDGTLVASTRAGLFRHDGTAFRREAFGNLGAQRHDGELLRVVQGPDGRLWAYGVTRVFQRDGKGVWREEPVAPFRRGGLGNHAFEADGRLVLIGTESLLLYDRAASPPEAVPPTVQLRAVTLLYPDGHHEAQPLARDGEVRVPPGNVGIRFEFALPDHARPGTQRYRGRLLPYETQFSEWSRSHGYTYSRLRPDDYRLEVEAMDSRGRVSAIEPFAVRVEPRWYATVGARLFTALLAAVFLWLAILGWVRARTLLLAAQKQKLESTIAERTGELADANRRLEMMAHIDGLTGIPNRRRLDEYLAVVWEQCAERGRPLSLLAIDVDRFKEFNDRRGHLAGDELLRQLVQRLAHCLRRAEDLLARYGGEEFLVVLPGADLAIAATLAEAMRKQIEQSDLGATVSIGVASRVPDADSTLTELVARADAALYIAKKAGRNRVELAAASVATASA